MVPGFRCGSASGLIMIATSKLAGNYSPGRLSTNRVKREEGVRERAIESEREERGGDGAM